MRYLTQFLIFLSFASIFISNTSCASITESNNSLRTTIYEKADTYKFNYLEWEIKALVELTDNSIKGNGKQQQGNILCSQIEEILKENQIPIIPVLNVRLEMPPYLLIISPRNKIEYFDRVLLKQDMTVAEMEKLEAAIDSSEIVSVVEELGGFAGVYPPIVNSKGSKRFIITATTEEWVHQYLGFKPLGFLYLLDSIGLRQHPDIITLNETLANMVSEEVGDLVIHRFYANILNSGSQEAIPSNKAVTFDFDSEMRITRINADKFLSDGNTQLAEKYMEERRLFFVANGYQIRKLNQAYFAFHGIYGQDPASVSPVHDDLKRFRDKSTSIKEFLEITAGMTGYADLKNALKR